jgi:hypothetical protein
MTIHLVVARKVCGLIIALLATHAPHLAAQEFKLYSEILPDGAASVGPDWAELVFPPLELSNTGCARTYDYPPAKEPMRIYYWGAQTRFTDAFTAPTDHFTTLDVRFELPARVPITDARLDSALAVANLDVLEYTGEPPMPMIRTRPKHAWARREGRSVHIRIEGREAVEALLRPRGDSIDLHSCRRQDTTYVFPWRTRIVGGAAGPPKPPTAADSVAAFAAAVDAILADDSTAAHVQPPASPEPSRPDSAPDVRVRFGKAPAGEWVSPSIARLRRWHWRAQRWSGDSLEVPAETGGKPAPNVFAAFPSEIVLTFTILGDTAHVTEIRLPATCMPQLFVARPIWWVDHVLAATPSGWRQVRTKSAMARAGCN